MRARGVRVTTDALLVRRVAFGEADVVATFFTEARGVVATVARGARRSSKRYAALEPVHLLRVTFEERPGAELAPLVDAAIARPRVGAAQSLDALDAAGVALRWVRKALPPHTAEPSVWHDLGALLDALDRGAARPRARAAGFGLRLLSDLGWGLELERCATCGKP
ncbi:MAG TPA: DNA repair protein RecO, partial [Minicystis sp.]|nr:DNA repair protein RecO [Minicystis sp.]